MPDISGYGIAPLPYFPQPQTSFPVFNQAGKMQGNLTGNYGQPPSANLPGSTLDNIQGATVSTPAGSSIPNTAQATNAAIATPQAKAGSLGDLLARAVIIVLGFIFIAVGLNMLRPGTIPNPIRPR